MNFSNMFRFSLAFIGSARPIHTNCQVSQVGWLVRRLVGWFTVVNPVIDVVIEEVLLEKERSKEPLEVIVVGFVEEAQGKDV